MKIGFLNATFLKKHICQLRKFLTDNNSYHVFGVSETRLGDEVNDNVVDIPGYSVLRQDRNISGGGVLLYIRENFKAKILCSSKTQQRGKPLKPEYLFCSVWEGNSTPTFVAVVYRPPDVAIRSDRKFIQLLRSHCSDFSHKVIIGNWNADVQNPRDSDTRFLFNLMNNLSLKLVDTGPSHHSKDNDT